MAITNKGTKNNLPAKQLPASYVLPTVAIFGDENYRSENHELDIAKSTVENASNEVTMAAIITAITAAVTIKLANDYVATNTVEAFSVLTGLSINYKDDAGDSDWLGSNVATYNCKVKIYVKIS